MNGWIICENFNNILYPEEYEIERFIKEAENENIDLKVVTPEQIDILVLKNNKNNIFLNGKSITLPDFIIPRSGAETSYHTLAILRQFEKLGVFILNSSHTIEVTKDKLYTHQLLSKYELPIPKTILMKFPLNMNLISKYIDYPLIVKTISGTHGSGVFMSESKNNFKDLALFLQTINKDANIILQEFINDKNNEGKDLRILTIGRKIIACMERRAAKGHYKTNYSAGGKVSKYKVTPEIKSLTRKIIHLLNLEISGIDLLFGKDQLYICEINSAPGFKGIESCCGVNIPKETFKYLRIKLGY